MQPSALAPRKSAALYRPDVSRHGTKAWYPDYSNYSRTLAMLFCGKYAMVDAQKFPRFLSFHYHYFLHSQIPLYSALLFFDIPSCARMAVFALISEFPFDLAFQVTGKQIRIRELFSYQNVMITLLLGLVLMYLYEWIKMKYLLQPLIFNTLGVIWSINIVAHAISFKTNVFISFLPQKFPRFLSFHNHYYALGTACI